MKLLVCALILSASFNLFATDSMSLVLSQPEVEKLANDLKVKSFELSRVVDNYATSGVHPRCACESMTLTFTKFSSGKKSEQSYSVITEGFGTSLKVLINKN